MSMGRQVQRPKGASGAEASPPTVAHVAAGPSPPSVLQPARSCAESGDMANALPLDAMSVSSSTEFSSLAEVTPRIRLVLVSNQSPALGASSGPLTASTTAQIVNRGTRRSGASRARSKPHGARRDADADAALAAAMEVYAGAGGQKRGLVSSWAERDAHLAAASKRGAPAVAVGERGCRACMQKCMEGWRRVPDSHLRQCNPSLQTRLCGPSLSWRLRWCGLSLWRRGGARRRLPGPC